MSSYLVSAHQNLLSKVRANPVVKERLKRLLDATGYDTTDWVRVVLYQRCFAFIRTLDPTKLDVLEISGGRQWHRHFNFKSYAATSYPGFDVCAETTPRQYDLIIADQVFEHLEWPQRAAKNVLAMLRPGGHAIISAPFMVRVHASPIDCSRWTPHGMSCLLQDAGFPADHITTDSWGNRACIRANFNRWAKRGYGSLRNEPDFPVMVWAFARKPAL